MNNIEKLFYLDLFHLNDLFPFIEKTWDFDFIWLYLTNLM